MNAAIFLPMSTSETCQEPRVYFSKSLKRGSLTGKSGLKTVFTAI